MDETMTGKQSETSITELIADGIKEGCTPQEMARAIMEELVPKKLMFGDGPEQLVWLVWEMVADRPTLAVICTTDDDLNRYVTPDRKTWFGGGPVWVERVMTDHRYGASDMRVVMGIMRNAKNAHG